MTITVTAQHEKFLNAAQEVLPNQVEFSTSQIRRIVKESGCPSPSWLKRPEYRVGHGTYSLELAGIASSVVSLPVSPTAVGTTNILENDVKVIPFRLRLMRLPVNKLVR